MVYGYNSKVDNFLRKKLKKKEFNNLYQKIAKKVNHKDFGGIRIYLTEKCNANCEHCFNKDMRKKGHSVKAEELKKMMEYFSGHSSSVKVLGGEPTIHPKFLKFYESFKKKFNSIALYTNALNQEILKSDPRDSDGIVYNFRFITESFDFNKLMPEKDCYRGFETAISKDSDLKLLKKQIILVVNKLKEFGIKNYSFQLTLNLVEDIFKNKKILNKKLKYLMDFLNKNSINFSFDHRLPICFFDNLDLFFLVMQNQVDNGSQKPGRVMCVPEDSLVIYPDFTMYYCNQFPYKIGNLFKEKDIISYESLLSRIKHAYILKNMVSYLLGCRNCEFWFKICNGGCWKHRQLFYS